LFWRRRHGRGVTTVEDGENTGSLLMSGQSGDSPRRRGDKAAAMAMNHW
jgi:hypothetical protein